MCGKQRDQGKIIHFGLVREFSHVPSTNPLVRLCHEVVMTVVTPHFWAFHPSCVSKRLNQKPEGSGIPCLGMQAIFSSQVANSVEKV